MWPEWWDDGVNVRVTAHLTMLIQPQDLYGVEWRESSTYKNGKVLRVVSSADAEFTWRSRNVTGTAGTSVPIRFNITVQPPGKRSVLEEKRGGSCSTHRTEVKFVYRVKAVKLTTVVKRPRFDGTGKFLWHYTWPFLHNLAALNLVKSFKLGAALYMQVQTPSVGRRVQFCVLLYSGRNAQPPSSLHLCRQKTGISWRQLTHYRNVHRQCYASPIPGPLVSVLWTVPLHVWQLHS
jgi:hypothetical protein